MLVPRYVIDCNQFNFSFVPGKIKWDRKSWHHYVRFNCNSLRPQGPCLVSFSDFQRSCIELFYSTQSAVVGMVGTCRGWLWYYIIFGWNVGRGCFQMLAPILVDSHPLEMYRQWTWRVAQGGPGALQIHVRRWKQCSVHLLSEAHCFHATEKASAEVWISKINK